MGYVKNVKWDLSENNKVKNIRAGGVTFLNGGFNAVNQIDSLALIYTGISSDYLAQLPQLKYLSLNEGNISKPFENIYEFSANPLLEEVSITSASPGQPYSFI